MEFRFSVWLLGFHEIFIAGKMLVVVFSSNWFNVKHNIAEMEPQFKQVFGLSIGVLIYWNRWTEFGSLHRFHHPNITVISLTTQC